ncbi:RNA ligase family protein [Rhodococcus qingshengii]|uniref:RNA ligase family protein n=1 Tax=Rhodococcus qingshengii TaxID=334542 RepID=UPI0035DF11F1
MINRIPLVETATKYPSISTYHALGQHGRLTEEVTEFDGPVYITEKIDGTDVRVIVDSSGDYLIGGRENILYAKGDRVANPAQGVVEAIRSFVDVTDLAPQDGVLRTYFVEVYGGKIGKNHVQYSWAGNTGFSLFDVADVPLDVLDQPREDISIWRQKGGQVFLNEDDLTHVAKETGFLLAPRVGVIDGADLPRSILDMYRMMEKFASKTLVAVDDGAVGYTEGVVLRSHDRSSICKARFENYVKTLPSSIINQ